ncbi:MAG: WHG domain-containing protein [Spirochaetota bacterium]
MPRQKVSQKLVFDTAEQISKDIGLAALNLKHIADRLNIKPPSLYKHIKNIEQISDELALRGYTGIIGKVQEVTVGVSGEIALLEFARAYRKFATMNPSLYEAMQPTHVNRITDIQARADQLLNIIFKILQPFKLKNNKIHAVRALRSYIDGFVRIEILGGFGMDENVDASFDYGIRLWLKGIQAK